MSIKKYIYIYNIKRNTNHKEAFFQLLVLLKQSVSRDLWLHLLQSEACDF